MGGVLQRRLDVTDVSALAGVIMDADVVAYQTIARHFKLIETGVH